MYLGNVVLRKPTPVPVRKTAPVPGKKPAPAALLAQQRARLLAAQKQAAARAKAIATQRKTIAEQRARLLAAQKQAAALRAKAAAQSAPDSVATASSDYDPQSSQAAEIDWSGADPMQSLLTDDATASPIQLTDDSAMALTDESEAAEAAADTAATLPGWVLPAAVALAAMLFLRY